MTVVVVMADNVPELSAQALPSSVVTELGSTKPSSAAKPSELMACVGCRSRKLKCSRDLPACARCTRLKIDCIYPESRRKPLNKRKNVKELEARLALVEDLLKDAAAKPKQDGLTSPSTDTHGDVNFQDVSPGSVSGDGSADAEFVQDDAIPNMTGTYVDIGDDDLGQPTSNNYFNTQELMGMGMFEVPPPSDIIDEMQTLFFQNQHHFIPIVHPGRYLQAFHSAPHMRPPMALQYAIWAMAAFHMEKYSAFHDLYYRRARQYLETDELKGVGEHFITVQHAQAWVLVAAYEARTMHFTRAAMSCARGIKLCHMMGLHRLDEPDYIEKMTPTILPPQSWVELEERRRVFWGAFVIDSHASVATGWPSMIDPTMITSNVPSSEEAFVSDKAEETVKLKDMFFGASYSRFAGSIGICYIFNKILAHVNQTRPDDDHIEDLQYGAFWKRHRDIDNLVSSAFMFLPLELRLPENYRNPVSIYTNLNLHASVICLHQNAVGRAETTSELSDTVKQSSMVRLINSADEIVNIMKQAVNMNSTSAFKNPLVALALYCAASVYMYLSGERRSEGEDTFKECKAIPSHVDALEFIIQCLVAVGRVHNITHAFLRQVIADLDHYNLASLVRIPVVQGLDLKKSGYNIPLLARTSLAKHAHVQSPLPGYLPLGNPMGQRNNRPDGLKSAFPATWTCEETPSKSPQTESRVVGPGNGHNLDGNRGKRRRMSMANPGSQDQPQDAPRVNPYVDNWQYGNEPSGMMMGFTEPARSAYPQQQQRHTPGIAAGSSGLLSPFQTALPHRNSNSSAGSPVGVCAGSRCSSNNTPAATSGTTTYSNTSVASEGGNLFGGQHAADIAGDQMGFMADEMWNAAEMDAFVQSTSSNSCQEPQVSAVGTENQPMEASWNFLG